MSRDMTTHRLICARSNSGVMFSLLCLRPYPAPRRMLKFSLPCRRRKDLPPLALCLVPRASTRALYSLRRRTLWHPHLRLPALRFHLRRLRPDFLPLLLRLLRLGSLRHLPRHLRPLLRRTAILPGPLACLPPRLTAMLPRRLRPHLLLSLPLCHQFRSLARITPRLPDLPSA